MATTRTKSKKASDHMASTIDHIAQAADMLLQEDNSFMVEREVWTKRLGKLQTQNATLREKAAASKMQISSMKKEIIHSSNEVEILDGDVRQLRSEKAELEHDLSKAREIITDLKNSVEVHEDKEMRDSDTYKATLSRLENKLGKAQTLLASRNKELTEANHTISHLNEDRVRIMNEHQRELEGIESNHNQEIQLLNEKHHNIMLEHAETHRVDLILANERTASIIKIAEEKDKRLREEHDKLITNLHEEHHSSKHTIASEVYDHKEATSSQIKELEEKLTKSNNECETLQIKLNKIELDYKKQQETFNNHNDKILEEHNEIIKNIKEDALLKQSKRDEDHSTMLQKLTDKIEEFETSSSKLRNELLTCRLNISTLESKDIELNEEKVRYEKKCITLDDELKKLRNHSRQEIENKNDLLDDITNKLSNLEMEYKSKKSELNKTKNRLEQVDESYKKLSLDYDTVLDKLNKIEKDFKELKIILKIKEENIENFNENVIILEKSLEKMKEELNGIKTEKETYHAQADSYQFTLQTTQLSLDSLKLDYEKIKEQMIENSKRAEETQLILKNEANQGQATLESWLNQSKQEVSTIRKALEIEKEKNLKLEKEFKLFTLSSEKQMLELRNKKVLSLFRYKSHQLKVYAIKHWKTLTVKLVVKTEHEEKLEETVNELRRDRESNEFSVKQKYEEEIRLLKTENVKLIESYESQILILKEKAKRELALHSHEVNQDNARVEGRRVEDQLEFLEVRHALENEIHHVRGLFLLLIAKRRRHRLVLIGWKALCYNSVATAVTNSLGEKHKSVLKRTSEANNKQLKELKNENSENVDNLKREIKTIREQFEKENSDLKCELEETKLEYGKLKRKYDDFKTKHELEINSLNSELDDCKDDRDEIKVNLGEITRNKHILNSDFDDLNRVLDNVRKKNIDYDIKLRETTEELDTTKTICENLRETVEKLTNKLKTTITSLEHSHILCKEVRNDLEITINEKEQLTHDIMNSQVKIKNLENVKNRLQSLSDELQNDIESHELIENGLRRDFRKLEQKYTDKENDYKDVENKLEICEENMKNEEMKYNVLDKKYKEIYNNYEDEKESHKITKDELSLSLKKYNEKNMFCISLQESIEKKNENHSMHILFTVSKRLYLRKLAVVWCRWRVNSECSDVVTSLRHELHMQHIEEINHIKKEHVDLFQTYENNHEIKIDKMKLSHRKTIDNINKEYDDEIEILKKNVMDANENNVKILKDMNILQNDFKEKEVEMIDKFKRKELVSQMWSKWLLLIAKQKVEESVCEGLENEFHSATDLLRIEHNSEMKDLNIQHEHNILDMKKSYEQGIDVLKSHLQDANGKVSTLMTRMALVQGQLRDAEKVVSNAKKSEEKVVNILKGKDAQIDAERRKAEAITRHLGEVQSRLLSWGLNVDGFSKHSSKQSKTTPVESSTN